MTTITTYKSKIASRYIPVDAEQIGLKIAESEYYMASIKHDGHLAFLIIKNGKAQLFDRNGDELNVPGITKAAALIKDDMVLAGELCCFENQKSMSHREVSAAIAKPAAFDLRFGAFDLLEFRSEAVNEDVNERLNQLHVLLSKGKEVFAIEQHCFKSRKDIITFFKSAVEQKAEGVIVKVANGVTYKIKQVHHLDLVVLGYAESTGDREGWLRELLLGLALDEHLFQIIAKCASGFTDQERKDWPAMLQPLHVESEYTEVSGAKTAFMFVKPEVVVEISCLDLINETTDGAITKAVVSYTSTNGYTHQSQAPTISLISPVFKRLRNDKKAIPADTGAAQAYALCAPLAIETATLNICDSQVIIRDIFTKSGKGGVAVRKFVGLNTQKAETGLYAPFLAIFTDYAAGRKTPLEQDLYLCASETELRNKVKDLKEEHVKKGWEAYT